MDYTDPTTVYEGGTRNISVLGGKPLATTRLPIYSGFSLAILDNDGSSLNERVVKIAAVERAHRIDDYYEESDIRVCLLAVLYHVNNLIDEYVWACRLFDEVHPQLRAPENSGNTSNVRVSFEIDAFTSAARRVYEALRKLIWKHFRPGADAKSRWRSYETMLKALATADDIDPELRSLLQSSWSDHGLHLKSYRDSIAHGDPLDDGAHTCWMSQIDGRWRMTYRLPANPEAKSRRAFDFASGPDALSYCWQTASHLVRLCEVVCDHGRISTYITDGPSV